MATEALAEVRDRIQSAAETAGGAVVDAVVLPGGEAHVPVAPLDADQFVDLLGKVRPTIVYLHAAPFEAEIDVVDELVGDADDPVGEDKRVKAFIKKWKQRDGQILSVVASFMKDGVLHTLLERPDWYEDFENAVTKLAEAMDDENGSLRDQQSAAEKAEIQKLATQLAKHPKFMGAGGRAPSKEKRIFLASELFPDCEEYKLREIVELAANLDWYGA